MNDNLELWNKVRTPDPKYVKQFNRGGGFKGSSTNFQYIAQRATEIWGPNGIGWGVEIEKEEYINGSPIFGEEGQKICDTVIHVVLGRVWYLDGDETRKTSPQFGQTTFVGSNKYGPFTDEEAPKKSITDMTVKCLSLLGFSADIFLGLWDDNKYVNDAKKRFEDIGTKQQKPTIEESFDKAIAWIDSAISLGLTVEKFDECISEAQERFAKFKGVYKTKIEQTIKETRAHLEEVEQNND